MKQFGERLKEERTRLRKTQAELAASGGVQKQAQSRYESGERRPDSDYLEAIAKEGIDVLYLLTGRRCADVLSESEDALLSGFRALDARGQSGVIGLVAGMTGDEAET